MVKLSYDEIDIVLRNKEKYYRGLSKGSTHDQKVAFYGLQAIRGLREDFKRKIANKSNNL